MTAVQESEGEGGREEEREKRRRRRRRKETEGKNALFDAEATAGEESTTDANASLDEA